MRIYFFPQKIIKLGLVVVLAVFFLGCFACYFGSSIRASRVEDPIYQGNTGQKVVALTFNVDWGEEFIPDLLKVLDKHKAKATFFVTGKWASKFPALTKEIKARGHDIGNHGYRHAHLNNLSLNGVTQEIIGAQRIIEETTGEKPALFAPPYGEYNTTVQKAVADLDYKLIMWSLDTIDWQRPEPATIVKRVVPRIHNDAIILMHPTQPTVEALPVILTELKKEGYEFLTVGEIIKGPPSPDKKEEKGK